MLKSSERGRNFSVIEMHILKMFSNSIVMENERQLEIDNNSNNYWWPSNKPLPGAMINNAIEVILRNLI